MKENKPLAEKLIRHSVRLHRAVEYLDDGAAGFCEAVGNGIGMLIALAILVVLSPLVLAKKLYFKAILWFAKRLSGADKDLWMRVVESEMLKQKGSPDE